MATTSRASCVALVCSLLVALACADQMNTFAQQSASAHCAYSGFQSSKYCPPIAGFSYAGDQPKTPEGLPVLAAMIGLGYDPVAKRIGLPVTASSYSANAAWSNSKGVKFGVPDQVNIALANVNTPVSNVFHYTDYKAYFAQAITAYDGNCLGGMFASSQNIENMYNQYFAGTKSLSVSQEYHTLFTLSMKSASPALDSITTAAIAWLPAAYNQALYFEFIRFWGTHYITSSTFGGMAEVMVESSTCLNTAIGRNAIEQMVQYDTENVLRPGSVPNSLINAQYAYSRKISSVDMVGGNPELASIAQWAQRVASFEDDPVNLRFTYQPVSNLIADATRRANMVRATQEYLAQGAAAAASQKGTVDALDLKMFMVPQNVYAVFWSPEVLSPRPPACLPAEIEATGVINGKSQPVCYGAPNAVGSGAIQLAPGNWIDYLEETTSGTVEIPVCHREPTTGQVNGMDNRLYHEISIPVQNGCSVGNLNVTAIPGYTLRSRVLWCCIGVSVTIADVNAQYGLAGQVPTIGCPAL